MKNISFVREPNGVSFDGEDSDEKIILLLRKHIITNLDWFLVWLLILAFPFFVDAILLLTRVNPMDYITPRMIFVSFVFWYLFAFGYAFTNFANWYYNVYIVSSKKIIDVDFHGILYRNVSEAPIRNIEDITNRISGVAQVVFHYGDVIIQTAGETREFDFNDVPDPSGVQDIVSDMVSNLPTGGHHHA